MSKIMYPLLGLFKRAFYTYSLLFKKSTLMVDNLVLATGKYEQSRVLSIFPNLKFPIFLGGMIIQWHFMSTIILGNIDLILL